MEESIFDFQFTALDGSTQEINQFAGHPILVVNTASKGIEKTNIVELNKIASDFSENGLIILGFPSRDFLGMEFKYENDIEMRYHSKFRAQFIVGSLTQVIGENADPLFEWLGTKAGKPDWNFTKYLIEQDGSTVKRFSSMDRWSKVRKAIDSLMNTNNSES